MKKIVMSLSALALLVVPASVLAQVPITPNFTYTDSWINKAIELTQKGVTFLMVIATIYFLISVIRFIMDKGDKAEATTAKKKAMGNGIIGLFVMVGIWGIIRIISSTLGVGGGSLNPASVPCPPGQSYDAINRICR